jgi:hypothetical protein
VVPGRISVGSHREVVDVIQRFRHWIVPAVFMLIGAAIVLMSGVLTDADRNLPERLRFQAILRRGSGDSWS